jgi:hypothetical protein
MEYPNRLAVEGETLVLHRFRSGSLGLASARECCAAAQKPASSRTFWGAVKDFFNPPEVRSAPAVCIPPGARLILHDISTRVQKEFSIGACEEVAFVQLTAMANFYRDGVRFRTGDTLRLQDLLEGQRVDVIDLGNDLSEEPDAWPLYDTEPASIHRRR